MISITNFIRVLHAMHDPSDVWQPPPTLLGADNCLLIELDMRSGVVIFSLGPLALVVPCPPSPLPPLLHGSPGFFLCQIFNVPGCICGRDIRGHD